MKIAKNPTETLYFVNLDNGRGQVYRCGNRYFLSVAGRARRISEKTAKELFEKVRTKTNC